MAWRCPCGHEIEGEVIEPPFRCNSPGCSCEQCHRDSDWPISIGDRVRMKEDFKARLRENDSGGHVDEFGDCIGVVDSMMYPDTDIVDIVNVRWQPSNLRYGYLISNLVRV